jgi:hypothetical protein
MIERMEFQLNWLKKSRELAEELKEKENKDKRESN